MALADRGRFVINVPAAMVKRCNYLLVATMLKTPPPRSMTCNVASCNSARQVRFRFRQDPCVYPIVRHTLHSSRETPVSTFGSAMLTVALKTIARWSIW